MSDPQSTRPPTMLDSLIPIFVLICLLIAGVTFFGDGSSSGPNQIALLLATGVAAVIGIKNGH